MGSMQRSLLQSNIPPEHESKFFSTSEGSTSTFMTANSSNKSHVSDHSHQFHHQISNYGVMNSSPSALNHPSSNFMSKDGGGSYDMCGEFDQALSMYFDGQSPPSYSLSEQKINCAGMKPPTLNIFPSQPMHVDPSPSNKVSPMDLVNSANGGSKLPTHDHEPSQTKATAPPIPPTSAADPPHPKPVKREGNTGRVVDHDRPRTPDAKTLRRLAQNREAARKSRLRKKAYIQQLESSRVKLTQLEQELQRSARAQGLAGTSGGSIVGEHGLAGMSNLSSDAVVFDVEYARWLDEHHRLMYELRSAMQEHTSENDLRLFVDSCLSHFNEVINLKSMIAKSDVFHLISGTWKTPAERCFMWIGGFRPSDLIKMIPNQIGPMSEQQVIAICELQHSTVEAEEALSQGLNALNQSISTLIVSDSLTNAGNMTNYMGQMGVAMAKLSTLEGFVRQADTLRHQTAHRLNQLLTTRQAAKSIIAVAEFFQRLRTLSSLWAARPRQD